MNDCPLVSIYIPTYNRLALLKRAINSVLNQTYTRTEIIIVDDGSTDGTKDYLEKIAAQHDNIIVVFNENNSGSCISRNTAIFKANGFFITGLDDDDYFLPDRIHDFVKGWTNNIAALYSNLSYKIDGDSELLFSMKPIVTKKEDMLLGCKTGCQVFTKTAYLRKVGGFDATMPMWQDLECWYRLLDIGNAIRVDNASYVVDISHPHERISNKKFSSVLFAYNYFSIKHQLCPKQMLRLKCQTINYNPSVYKYTRIFFKAIFYSDPQLAHLCLSNIRALLKDK